MSPTPRLARVGTALLISVILAACADEKEAASGGRGGARSAVPVVVEAVQMKPRRTRIEAVGTARARQSVSLFSESAGEVVSVNFQPGDRVDRGDVLLELDARDEKLALELAEVRLAEAKRLLERYTEANASAERTVPETTVDTAATALETARIERDRAAIALERRYVKAPLDGYVGITDIDAGDRIEATTEITTIDDRSALLVSFDVPEAFVGRLKTGDPIHIDTWTAEGTEAEGRVIDLGSRVDPVSRAFVARAEVPNSTDALRPGMSFRVTLELEGAAYPTVPDVALQWGADGAYVWIAEDGKARRVPAKLLQRQEGRVLVEADFPENAQVIGEGVQSMRDGVPVRTMDAAALARDARGVLTSAAREG